MNDTVCSECGEKLRNTINKNEWYCLNDCPTEQNATVTVYLYIAGTGSDKTKLALIGGFTPILFGEIPTAFTEKNYSTDEHRFIFSKCDVVGGRHESLVYIRSGAQTVVPPELVSNDL